MSSSGGLRVAPVCLWDRQGWPCLSSQENSGATHHGGRKEHVVFLLLLPVTHTVAGERERSHRHHNEPAGAGLQRLRTYRIPIFCFWAGLACHVRVGPSGPNTLMEPLKPHFNEHKCVGLSMESQGPSQDKNVSLEIAPPIIDNRVDTTQPKNGGYTCLCIVPFTIGFLEALHAWV
jgi:hypothetical protein